MPNADGSAFGLVIVDGLSQVSAVEALLVARRVLEQRGSIDHESAPMMSRARR